MSTAYEKNAQAMRTLFGSEDLARRLVTTRIAVVLPEAAKLPAAGQILAEVLADSLARLWPNIDFTGAGAESMLHTAREAAKSGSMTGGGLSVRWAPPYDCVVSIGCEAGSTGGPAFRVGADGWLAMLGPDATCGDSRNPVGPAFSAAYAAAQTFRRVFNAELGDLGAAVVSTYRFDVRELSGVHGLETEEMDVGQTHVFGVGAVTHAFLWLLQRWPARVTGQLELVDQDLYGSTNGQRYAFMTAKDLGQQKVEVMRQRLAGALALTSRAHGVDLNTYCQQRGHAPLDRIIVGLDSAESRRHAALKLPERAINMWTEGVRIGASRYRPGGTSACLACDYPESTTSTFDEVSSIWRQTGLRPDLVRSLLDTPRALSDAEAAIVAQHCQLPPGSLVGQPLRSILPILCATGKVPLGENKEAVDVPFAFASLFAGIAAFMMLLKDVAQADKSEAWIQHIFKPPSALMNSQRNARPDCLCCSELVD